MKFYLGLVSILFYLTNIYSQSPLPLNVISLNGTYDLYDNANGKISTVSTQSMTIMTFDNNKFVVHGVSPGNKYWLGMGELKGNEGYFDYRFEDGRYGQTTFRIDKYGNLDAYSINYTTEYKYIAKPRNE